LLRELSTVEDLHWIRLLYCYPTSDGEAAGCRLPPGSGGGSTSICRCKTRGRTRCCVRLKRERWEAARRPLGQDSHTHHGRGARTSLSSGLGRDRRGLRVVAQFCWSRNNSNGWACSHTRRENTAARTRCGKVATMRIKRAPPIKSDGDAGRESRLQKIERGSARKLK